MSSIVVVRRILDTGVLSSGLWRWSSRRRILKPTADDLVEVLRSLGCDCVAVASHQEALQALRATAFCLILRDLQIKYASEGIKGHVEHGKALLREIRQMYGDHSGVSYWLPVLIVSGCE